MSSERLILELRAAGLPCVGMREGALMYDRSLTVGDQELADLVIADHIDDDTDYANASLDDRAAALKSALGAAGARWAAYEDLQKVTRARVAGLPEWAARLLDALADGKDLAAIQAAVKSLRDSRLSS